MKTKTVFLSFSVGETSVSDYFISLSKKIDENYNVVIFSDTKKPLNILLPASIEIKYWPSKRPTKFKDAFFLYKNIKKYKPIMTISIFGSVNIFLLIGFLCRVNHRVAWIRTLSTQFDMKKQNIIRKSLVYRLATNIITNSIATKEDAIKVFKVKESKIKVLPNTVTNYRDSLNNSSVEKFKILYVGRLHNSKGVDVLIKAIAELVNQNFDVFLDIIGNGPEEKNLKELTNKLNISNQVSFLGGKNKIEVLNAFKKSYCAVIPSRSEAFGYTVIEAMSVGTCVVGANNTGIKEIIIHNQTGLLFETNNPHDLSLQIKTILLDERKRDNLANKGYERFLSTYETTKAIKSYMKYFSNLLSSSN